MNDESTPRSDSLSNAETENYEPFTRRHGRLLIILIIGAITIGVAVMQRKRMSYHDGTAHRLVGQQLAEIQLQPWNPGDPTATADSLRGKISVINFWGTWCPPCRLEMPHLVELYEEFRHDQSFQLFAVTCRGQPGQTLESLRAETSSYLETLPTQPPVFFDHDQVTRRYLTKLGTDESVGAADFVYPTTVVVDQDGTIQGVWEGYAPGIEKLQRSLIKSLLRQSQAAPAAPSQTAQPTTK